MSVSGKKEYVIKINGLSESVSQVEALNKQLDQLAQRINSLPKNAVASVGGTSAKELNDEVVASQKLEVEQKKIIANTKERKKLAESIAASERMVANEYGNTMNGLKQKLKDIKTLMGNEEIGSDAFKDMTQWADELNSKLKEIEQSYGQFGRNVGNYKSAAEGFKGLSVVVGGVERKFKSTRDASKQMREELKAMVANEQQNTKEYKELSKALEAFEHKMQRANSAVNDLKASSKFMDDILDMGQSFAAMSQISNGFKGLFGFDNDEIERSIQKLVSLQNMMQGLEKIQKQIITGEGIGSFFSNTNKSIDKFIVKMTSAEFRMGKFIATTKSGSVALNGFAKGLRTVAALSKVAWWMLVMEGISMIVSETKKWATANADAIDSERLLELELEKTNAAFDERIELLKDMEKEGLITNEQRYAETLKEENKLIQEQINKLYERSKASVATNFNTADSQGDLAFLAGFRGYTSKDWKLEDTGDEVKSIEEAEKLIEEYNKALQKNVDIHTYREKQVTNFWDRVNLSLKGIVTTVGDTKSSMSDLANSMVGNFLAEWKEGLKGVEEGTEEYDEAVRKLLNRLDSLGNTKNILTNPEAYIKDKEGVARIKRIGDEIKRVRDTVKGIDTDDLSKSINDSHKSSLEQHTEQLETLLRREAMLRKTIDKETDEKEKANLNKRLEANLQAQKHLNQDIKEDRIRQAEEASRKSSEIFAKELEYKRRLIESMQGSLYKRLEENDLNMNEELRAVSDAGYKVAEQQALVLKKYADKEREIRVEYAREVEDFWTNLEISVINKQVDFNKRMLQLNSNTMESLSKEQKGMYDKLTKQSKFYGSPFGGSANNSPLTSDVNMLVDSLRQAKTAYAEWYNLNDEALLARAKYEREFERIANEIAETESRLNDLQSDDDKEALENKKAALVEEQNLLIDNFQKEKTLYENKIRIAEDSYNVIYSAYLQHQSEMESLYGKDKVEQEKQLQIMEGYARSMSDVFENRLSVIPTSVTSTQFDYITKKLDDVKVQVEAEYQAAERAAKQSYDAQIREFNKFVDEHAEITEEQKRDTLEMYNMQYQQELDMLVDERDAKIKQAEEDFQADINKIVTENLKKRLSEYREYITAISQLEGRSPIQNSWGITNLKQTNAVNRELLANYQTLAKSILQEKQNLQKMLDEKQITFDEFENASKELQRFSTNLGEKMQKVKQDLSIGQQIEYMVNDINQYFQEAGRAVQTVLNSVWNYQDSLYESMMEALEEDIDAAKDKYSELEDIVKEYADNVNDIESELSTARGDRREALIDQLNEEKRAEREKIQEQKKAEQELANLEKKKEQEELKQRKKQHQRDITDAIVAGALATANGLATKPFVPVGIAMGSLAAALAAVQVSLIKKQKYAEGGLIQGKLHSQGGVPVGNTNIEVEGNEFITNRHTTAKNLDVLTFINSKRRRLDIGDFIDFYSSGKVGRNINSAMPKTRFADGGSLPTLRSDITISNRLADSFDAYANRPVVVAVTDIVKKNSELNKVKVLAGLHSESI